jgi:hypothetical protein
MQMLELTADEFEVLADLLQRGISEIDVEVFRTDRREFRDMLKRRRAILEQVRAKLGAEQVKA